MCLDIDLVKSVEDENSSNRQNEPFEDLVILEEYKTVVKALVSNHSRGSTPIRSDADENRQIDLIQGKGKGLIILLHGVPGVGKTSTAESVAAFTKRPLFPITCGDIGQTAEIVEERLEALFLLARKWGRVLLLDEADFFLAKRERGDVARNALVSVFLRVLEYYTGILFLTTNRVGSIDEAFKSRIHISLYYPALSKKSTNDVWRMNLTRIKRAGWKIDFKTEKILKFADQHWEDGNMWNGRQIRNAFQTAIALAEYDFQAKCKESKEENKDPPPRRPSLKSSHFAAVAKASAEFENYLDAVLGQESFSAKAKQAEIRNDSWQDRGIETSSGKSYKNQGVAVRPRLPSTVALTPSPNPRAAPITKSVESQTNAKRLEELRRARAEKERKERERLEREREEREAAEIAELEKEMAQEAVMNGSMAESHTDDDSE